MFKKLLTPLILYCIIFVFWLIYRSLSPVPPEWIDTFVAKPAIWLIPTFFVVKIIERRRIRSLGLSRKNFFTFTTIGLAAGILFFIYLKSFEVIFHTGEFHVNPGHLGIFGIFTSLTFGFATAATEELVFRGYIQAKFAKIFNSNFWGITLSTPLFAIIHIPIAIFVYQYSMQKILFYELYLVEVSILYALHFMYSKNLTSSIAAHSIIDFLSDVIV